MSRGLSRRRFLELSATAAVAASLPMSKGSAALAAEVTWGRPSGLLASLLPVGLGVPTGATRFSWELDEYAAGTRQTHHQLQVAVSPKALEDGPYVWDSGKVESAESVGVRYAGPELAPGTAYWWRVRAYNGDVASRWSRNTLLATDLGDGWTGTPIWTPAAQSIGDGVLRARVKITAVAASLWFRAASSSANYLWQLRAGEPGQLKTHVCVNGTYTTLVTENLNVPLVIGTWYDVAIEMTGSTFKTYLDGTLINTSTDTRYSTGTFGFRNGSTESNEWDSISFESTDGTVLVSEGFSSTTNLFSSGSVANGVLTLAKSQSALANWGSADDDWALLRHEFALSTKKISAAVLYVAAQSPTPTRQYPAKIWCNGELVGFASMRGGAGPARYHCFEVTSLLVEGERNVLAALAYTTSDKRFVAQLLVTYSDGTSQVVAATGSSWKARRQAQMLRSAGTVGSTYYTGPQEYWDMRYEPEGWTRPGFDDSGWENALAKNALTGLEPALVEPVGLYDVTPAKTTQTSAGTWIVDLGKEIAGGLRLAVNGKAGQTVEVRLGEELNADGTVKYALRAAVTYREVWTLRDGVQTIEHWGYRGFRYAQLISSDTSLDLSSAVTGRAWRAAWNGSDASFSSSSADLDRVYEFCRYSIEATRGDLYIDTPTRERGPYEGDALINQWSEYSVQRSYALARASDVYLTRNKTWPTEYRLMNVMSAWEDYLATGDPTALEADYDLLAAQNLTSYLRSDGLVSKSPSSPQDLVDWPTSNRDGYVFTNVNTVVNAVQYAAFVAMAKIATALGKTADAATWQARADKLATSMRSLLLDGAGGKFYDGIGTTHSAQHATAFAVALGVAGPGTVSDDVVRALGQTLASGGMKVSVYGAQFLLDALFACGRADAAIALMIANGMSSWLHMLDDLGATIVAEAWDPSLKSNMTFSHAWASAPANVIARRVLGVNVTAPGAATVEIRPRPGTLKVIKGTVPTIRGPIGVSLDRASGYRLEIDVPANTNATIVLELGTDDPARYTVTGDHSTAPRTVTTDFTGTLLTLGPVPSGRTKVVRS